MKIPLYKKTPDNQRASTGKNRKELFSVEDPKTPYTLAELLASVLPTSGKNQLIFVGVGSDRSTGDCLGPLVGSKLEERRSPGIVVLGTLGDPVHALNLKETLENINRQFKNPFILAVDAALGSKKNVGMIKIEEGPLLPGLAVKKNLPAVGDLHVTGTVNVSGHMEHLVLQNTRLFLVMNLARVISAGIHMALRKNYSFSCSFPSSSDLRDVP
ncbi:spore protease YyaC [Candidatus Contubernalis alkaliaceticus]|uniref:spore protease YyaC n=1 Tax=Candidatus Contubernalis alkaliaceticus TaxID=338645 RepID=UPI001F4BD587|nr:spore protease YyaC [Candidatus Contubernalis alkalaceticus]UNC93720.1 spore protease YyaC [Candidatus Contubernalis alkalaceticus]